MSQQKQINKLLNSVNDINNDEEGPLFAPLFLENNVNGDDDGIKPFFGDIKNTWCDKLTNFFSLVDSKSDKDVVYLFMYKMGLELSPIEMCDVLIQTIIRTNKKTVLLGSTYALYYFDNFDIDDELTGRLTTLFGALIESSNDIVKGELDKLLELYMTEQLWYSLKNSVVKTNKHYDYINSLLEKYR